MLPRIPMPTCARKSSATSAHAACLPEFRSKAPRFAPMTSASADVYGRKITAREIVMDGKASIPESGQHLVRVLQKNAPHNDSEKGSNK